MSPTTATINKNYLEPTKYCKKCELITPWNKSGNCIFCLWDKEERGENQHEKNDNTRLAAK